MPSICAIVVTFNRINILKENIENIFSQSLKISHLIVVDNGSSDGTLDYLKSHENPNLSLVSLDENLGFGAGLQKGMSYAQINFEPDYYWLLDDDSYPSSDLLKFIYFKSLEIDSIGIYGLSGYLHKKGIPKRPEKTISGYQIVDFVLVDNALIPCEIVNIIGFVSPDFFMMCEDYEYCQRAKDFGFPVYILFSENEELVNRLHLGSQKNSTSLIWRGYYHTRNHILILKQYYSNKKLIGLINRHFKIILHALIFGPYRLKKFRYRILGLWHGLIGVKGKTIDPKNF
ncbi:glycosyltransferase family 2 protein [Belliella marina]|uniref:Glycosyltransferase family 2 protein n=1 Tax=Belliella marina TaxID=1644146 RepID=A0ABW4VNT5_9BACT